MKYTNYILFLVLIAFLDIGLIVSSGLSVNGGICSDSAGIDAISCLSVDYIYNLIHLVAVIIIFYVTKNKDLKTSTKLMICSTLAISVYLIVAVIVLDIVKFFWLPIILIIATVFFLKRSINKMRTRNTNRHY